MADPITLGNRSYSY